MLDLKQTKTDAECDPELFLADPPQVAIDCKRHQSKIFLGFTSHNNRDGDLVRLSWHISECVLGI